MATDDYERVLRGRMVMALLDAGASKWFIRELVCLPPDDPLSSYLAPFPEQVRGDWSWRGYEA